MSETASHPPLSPDITAYLNRLVSAYPQIESIWLIGSRAQGTARQDSDWDFFVFATPEVLSALRSDESFRQSNVDLLIVTNGDSFESPWPHSEGGEAIIKRGNLHNYHSNYGSLVLGWQWDRISDSEARYDGSKSTWKYVPCRALRIYPPNPRR